MKGAAREALLDWIRASAAAGEPMPTDSQIVDELGLRSAEDARSLLVDLADRRLIRVQRVGAARTIELIDPAPPARAKPAKASAGVEACVSKIVSIATRSQPPAPAPTAPPPVSIEEPAPVSPSEAPATTLTTDQEKLFAWLTSVADAGEECPSNAAIAKRFNFASTSGGVRMMQALVDAGRITINAGNRSRVVTIVATGRATAASKELAAVAAAVPVEPPAEIAAAIAPAEDNVDAAPARVDDAADGPAWIVWDVARGASDVFGSAAAAESAAEERAADAPGVEVLVARLTYSVVIRQPERRRFAEAA